MTYGIQLYSVRDILKAKGMQETLRAVAAIGYKSVELAGFGDATAADTKKWLDELGLTVDGAHVSLKALTEDFEKTIADLKTVGCPRAIIPSAKIQNKEALDALQKGFAEASRNLEGSGIALGFHNHHKEYLPNEDGDIPMDFILASKDVFIELDTYWAYHAGIDPVAEMERLGDRLKLIHIKDGDPTITPESGKPLGKGSAPVAAVYQKAIEMGLPIVVESETLTPDGVTEAEICFRYLKSLEK